MADSLPQLFQEINSDTEYYGTTKRFLDFGH
jgi:hypothetical protein